MRSVWKFLVACAMIVDRNSTDLCFRLFQGYGVCKAQMGDSGGHARSELEGANTGKR